MQLTQLEPRASAAPESIESPTTQTDTVLCSSECSLNTWGRYLLLTCFFFLVPSFLVGYRALVSHQAISSLVTHAWNPLFWVPFPQSARLLKPLEKDYVYILVGLCAWFYYQGIQHFKRLEHLSLHNENRLLRSILKWTLCFSLVMAFVIPFHSLDLYTYINYGAEQAFHGLNPYRFPVSWIHGWQNDVMFHHNWANEPSNYGFAFVLLSKWLVALSGRHFGVAFSLFKLFNVGAHVVLTWLIYQVAKALPVRKPLLSALLYGWNPLVLLHAIANGHNDLLMALPVVASFWLLFSVKRCQWLAIPLWMTSVWIKYATLPALPFLVLYLFQAGALQTTVYGLILGGILTGLLFFPFRDLIGGLPKDTDLMTWYVIKTQYSLQAAVDRIYDLVTHGSFQSFKQEIQESVSWLLKGFYIGLWGNHLLSAFKRPLQPVDLVRITALLTAVLICVVSPIFHVWYVILFFPLVVLLPEGDKLRQFGILLSFTQLLAFTRWERVDILNLVPLIIPVLLVMGLPYLPFQKRLMTQ